MIIVSTDNEVMLGIPVKSPLLIDVILLSDKSLSTMHEIHEKYLPKLKSPTKTR
jgi:hypothetical protein